MRPSAWSHVTAEGVIIGTTCKQTQEQFVLPLGSVALHSPTAMQRSPWLPGRHQKAQMHYGEWHKPRFHHGILILGVLRFLHPRQSCWHCSLMVRNSTGALQIGARHSFAESPVFQCREPLSWVVALSHSSCKGQIKQTPSCILWGPDPVHFSTWRLSLCRSSPLHPTKQAKKGEDDIPSSQYR